jgi:hypothetical protein
MSLPTSTASIQLTGLNTRYDPSLSILKLITKHYAMKMCGKVEVWVGFLGLGTS